MGAMAGEGDARGGGGLRQGPERRHMALRSQTQKRSGCGRARNDATRPGLGRTVLSSWVLPVRALLNERMGRVGHSQGSGHSQKLSTE